MFGAKAQVACAVAFLSGLIVVMGLSTPAKGEECNEHGVAAYAAVQDESTVSVFANGVHRTGGFKNCLVIGPEDVFPPIYDFKIKRPSGPVIQILTPFTVRATFESKNAVRQLTVRDAKGQHTVNVVQLSHSGRGKGAPTAKGKRLILESTYQHAPVEFGIRAGGFRGIRITGKVADGQTVGVALNPNTCQLNEFGDRTICTKIAHTHIKAKLARRRWSDPKKMGRRIYRLETNDFPKSLKVYLIAPPSDSGYRIVLVRPNSRTVVALEKAP